MDQSSLTIENGNLLYHLRYLYSNLCRPELNLGNWIEISRLHFHFGFEKVESDALFRRL